MKWEVKLFVGGKVFNEEVMAANRDDALTTASKKSHCKSDGSQPSCGSLVSKTKFSITGVSGMT